MYYSKHDRRKINVLVRSYFSNLNRDRDFSGYYNYSGYYQASSKNDANYEYCLAIDRSLFPDNWNVGLLQEDRKSTRLNSSHVSISYAVFCLKKKKNKIYRQ